MKNQEIKFKNKSGSYSIIIGKNTLNILKKKIKLLCPKTKSIALVIDRKVPQKFKKKLKVHLRGYSLLFLSFSAYEKNKNFNLINKIV